MKSFKKKVYFHREKEENWDIEEESISRGFDAENILRLGSDVEMTVEIREDGSFIGSRKRCVKFRYFHLGGFMYKQIIIARKDLDMSPGKTRGTGKSCKYGFFN